MDGPRGMVNTWSRWFPFFDIGSRSEHNAQGGPCHNHQWRYDMKLTIEVADSLEIKSGDAVVVFDLTKINKERVAELVGIAAEAGFYKAGVDAAASAKAFAKENKMEDTAARETLIGKRVATWLTGEWGATRGSGNGLSELDREIVSMMRKAVKASETAWYKDAAEADRVARCIEAFGGLPEAQQKSITKVANTRIAKKKEEAAELAALKIEV